MVLNLLRDRCSIRKYSEKRIPEAEIKTILDAARLAPSWMNVQPWHFISVNSQETKDKLCELASGQQHIADASHVILMLADLNAWNKERFTKILEKKEGMDQEKLESIFSNSALYPKLHGEQRLLLRTIEQTSYAMSYILLQAKAMEIDSCVIGAFGNELTEFNSDLYIEVKQLLNIPTNNYIVGMITLGYKAESTVYPKKFRKEFDEVVSKEKYGENF